jgi:hypothetical protein
VSVETGTQVGTPSVTVLGVQASVGAGSQGSVTASVNSGGAPGIVAVPTGAATIPLPVSPSGAGLSLVPLANNASTATITNLSAAAPAVILGAPSSAAILTAPGKIPVDGGGGSGVDAGVGVVLTPGVPVADGAQGGVVARPIDLGGGTDAETVLVNPGLEASGLTTSFQPYTLDGAGLNLGSLLGHVGAQSSWLARLWHVAPWLVGLIATGLGLEIRRRRAAKAIDQPLPE